MNPLPSVPSLEPAGESQRVTFAQLLVYELRVRDAMSQPPVTAAPDDSLRRIQQLMKARRISGVPITRNGQLLGLVSIEDIIDALDKGHIDQPAERWMTRNVVSVCDHYSLVRAVAEFDRHEYGRFPVLDAGSHLVGILTRGDITNCLFHHLEKRAEQAVAHEAALVASRADDEKARRVVVRARVKSGDFDGAGRLSQRMRQVLRERGIDPEIRRRAAIVAYEAETNIIIHSLGGEIAVMIDPDQIVVDATDNGPGIDDIEQAMKEGWSTAGGLARELGFGAGMGLPNMKRCADVFSVTSTAGGKTRVHAELRLKKAGGVP